ncbi:endoribonuclease Dicer-like [Ornithodoros turicata]|uniref:endoribonuclease Dicer-like n=1 Tax=Ornithodoros turicata TaxID=34597 RepID=UPI00313A2A8B
MAIKRGDGPPPRPRRHHYLENVHTKTFTPMEYQVELLDTAKRQNSIVFLSTGKTFMVVMLIKELAYQVRKSLAEGGKRVVILVESAKSVESHVKMMEDYTDLKASRFPVALEDFEVTFSENHVLVMTYNIFPTLFDDRKVVKLVNLVVVDECDSALQDARFTASLKCLHELIDDGSMRVLAISPQLWRKKQKPALLEAQVQELEKSFASRACTASELTAISKYGSQPKEVVIVYEGLHWESEAFQTSLRLLDETLGFLWEAEARVAEGEALRQAQRYLAELCHTLVSLGPWCGREVAEQFLGEVARSVDSLTSAPSWSRVALLMVHTVLQQVSRLSAEMVEEFNFAPSVDSHQPSQLLHLLDILKEYKPPPPPEVPQPPPECKGPGKPPPNENATNAVDGDHVEVQKRANDGIPAVNTVARQTTRFDVPDDPNTLCGMVFVRQRITAYVLSQWLSELATRKPDEYGFLTPNFLVGKGSVGQTVLGLQRQEEVLQKFRSRECNLLVATATVGEGIEVPRCNLVVRFDPPESLHAYMHSKGKAKAANSRFYVMVPRRESARFLQDLHDCHVTEEILLKRSHEDDTTLHEVVDPAYADSLLPLYKPLEAPEAPKVTMSTAIALVNRYCAKLPSDTFTRLTPTCCVTEIRIDSYTSPSYCCSLRLPINSPLKHCVVGEVMPGKLLAKQAAALRACQELHKIGELDDNLLPQGKEAMRNTTENRFPDEEVPPGAPRPGTTKRRQYYDKRVSDVLKGGFPRTDLRCHLYSFTMKLTCPIPEEQNTRGRKIHDPADTSRGFGLITSKPVPPVCGFPVFTRSGEVTVKLEHLVTNLELTEDQLCDLMTFHRYTFTDVLRLEKYPMTFNPKHDSCSFLVVPVNTAGCNEPGWQPIDWPFVRRICQERNFAPRRVPEAERELFNFREEDYLDTVVMPWYRNLDKPQFFYVAEICQDLYPCSDFPDAGFETFDAYYREKYDIRVMNEKQPLLDVDHTSARLNLLTPRYVNRKGVTLPTCSEQTKRAKRENLQQKQILVPELCLIHPFPASLWRKAVCLPCVLYRLNSLLLAEHLRLVVARDIKVGMPQLPQDFEWPTLDFGWTLAEVLQKAQEAAKAEEERQAAILERTGIQPVMMPPSTGGATGMWGAPPPTFNADDLVIDTFDPSKVEIPDDDQLADAEIEQITSVSGPNFDWKPLPKLPGEPTPVPRIRYGSPSNFEAEGWDSEWDVEGSFVELDIPGLGYISGPGMFNMQGLSLDLATRRDDDDDIWDSFDEDEEEGSELGRSEWSRSPDPEGGEEGVDGEQSGGKQKEEEQTNWLSQCSTTEKAKEVQKEEKKEVVTHVDPKIEEWVAEVREKCVRNLEVMQKEGHAETEVWSAKYNRVAEALRRIAEHMEERTDKHAEEPPAPPIRPAKTAGEKNGLAFGELLPDRDKVQASDASAFRVHFDDQPDLQNHAGPSPSVLLQALTMSNANDGINLERLETVGDSFLKYAVTAHLYCAHPSVHEGKLSHLRSRQISNLNLYRLGRMRELGGLMVATKFEPSDNWLPPGYIVPPGLEQALIDSGLPAGHWNIGAITDLTNMNEAQIRQTLAERQSRVRNLEEVLAEEGVIDSDPYVPYNLLTQHSIPDKSIADCVEALIGAYLVSCGPRAALLFMSWLGLEVLPNGRAKEVADDLSVPLYGPLELPLVDPNGVSALEELLSGYDAFERRIAYNFRDRAYLLQAFTHASYHYNRLTDCYQRLEFLGDAVLDYLITRHLYEDPQRHSPGTLTDLRSALVNNTFFASLAVKYDFHRYFKNVSPGLFAVIQRFVEMKRHSDGDFPYHEKYYLEEEECEEAEEVEVPKALGDIFESVAGAIYLDSGMSLDTVWQVYYAMMKPEIEYFSTHVPKSPIRELLELEPQTAKFERAEMTLSGKVRIRVEVFGKGRFVGVGRNKRIAKCTAAKRALRALKQMQKDKMAAL